MQSWFSTRDAHSVHPSVELSKTIQYLLHGNIRVVFTVENKSMIVTEGTPKIAPG